MTPRPLGSTGFLVPPVGLGTVALGRTAGLRLAKPAKMPSDDEAIALLAAAADLGVNLIDTAPAYGVSERRLGDLLPRIAPRERWIISTKVGERFDPDADGGNGASRYDFAPAAMRVSVDQSLQVLRTDRVDLLLLHFASSGDLDARTLADGEVIGVMQEFKRRGKARFIGASVSSPAGAAAVIASMDVVMVELNAVRTDTLPIVESAAKAGRGVLIKKPLASGRADPAASLRMALGTPGVSAAIVGTTSAEHLKHAVQVASAGA